jgi:hypothetical protein
LRKIYTPYLPEICPTFFSISNLSFQSCNRKIHIFEYAGFKIGGFLMERNDDWINPDLQPGHRYAALMNENHVVLQTGRHAVAHCDTGQNNECHKLQCIFKGSFFPSPSGEGAGGEA